MTLWYENARSKEAKKRVQKGTRLSAFNLFISLEFVIHHLPANNNPHTCRLASLLFIQPRPKPSPDPPFAHTHTPLTPHRLPSFSMGVKGLWSLLSPVARPIKLETLEDKRLAIDSSIWLYQFQATMRDKDGRVLVNAHVLGFLRRINKLLFHGIRPVFVFDGGAPNLKRSTIAERKRKRSGAAANHARVAERLFAAQMRREAVKQAKVIRDRQLAKQAEARSQAEAPPGAQYGYVPEQGEDIGENATYLEDVEGVLPAPPQSPSQTPLQDQKENDPVAEAAARRKTFKNHDPYRLPDLPGGSFRTSTSDGKSDPRMATEDELQAFIEEMKPEDFDLNSPEFRQLPTDAQYEIIGDLRARSRQQSHRRLASMLRKAPTPLDFSKAQIASLSQRNNLTQQLLTVTDTIGNSGLQIPVRVASERNREYVLVRNSEAQGGGWVLGVRDQGTKDKPIVVEESPKKKKRDSRVIKIDSDSEQDQERDIEDEYRERPPVRPDPELRAMRQRDILDALTKRMSGRNEKKAVTYDEYITAKPNSKSKRSAPLFVNEDEEGDDAAIAAELQKQEYEQTGDDEREPARDHDHRPDHQDDVKADDEYEIAYQQSRLESARRRDAEDEALIRALKASKTDARLQFDAAGAGEETASSASAIDSEDEDDFEEVEVPLSGVQTPEAKGLEKEVDLFDVDDQMNRLVTEDEGSLTVEREENSMQNGLLPPSDGDRTITVEEQPPQIDSTTATTSAISPTRRWPERQVRPGHTLPPHSLAPAPIQPHRSVGLEDSRPRAPVAPPSIPRKVVDVEMTTIERPQKSLEPPIEIDQSPPLEHLSANGLLSQDPFAPSATEKQEYDSIVESLVEIPTVDRSEALVAPPIEIDHSPPPEDRSANGLLSNNPFASFANEEHENDSNDGMESNLDRALLRFTPEEDEIPMSEDEPAEDEDEDDRVVDDDDDNDDARSWSRSPTPLLPILEQPDLEEEGSAIDMNAEGADYARFLSQIKGRNLDQVQLEIDNEIRNLNQENKIAMRDSEDITQQMIAQIQLLLRLFGIPYVTAPMEAEAQCAELVHLNLVDGVITDDNDVFLFGGSQCFKNLFNDAKFVECFQTADLEKELSLTRDRLINLAYLLGSDYTLGLTGVGPVVAMEIMANFPGVNCLDNFKTWWTAVQQGKDDVTTETKWQKSFKKKFSDIIYLTPDWPNPLVRDAYWHPAVDSSDEPFQWGFPDLAGLRSFLQAELSWSISKIDDELTPIIQRIARRGQAGSLNKQSLLDPFFDSTIGQGSYAPRIRTKYPSKRLQAVIKSFREAEAREAGKDVPKGFGEMLADLDEPELVSVKRKRVASDDKPSKRKATSQN